MNLKDINKKVLFDQKLEVVAGFSSAEMDVLVWLRELVAKHDTEKMELTAPGIVGNVANKIIERLIFVDKHRSEFFGFELVRQMGKEAYYIMDSGGKIVGRVQYVDDKI